MADVVVVGAGVGGLAAAIRLGRAGHDVVVLDRNDHVGGKLAARNIGGFSFETGPSLLTLPALFDELLACAGMSFADVGRLVRLDPACRYRFSDGSGFDSHSAVDDTAASVEAFSAGSGQAWRDYHAHGRRVWEVSRRTFFAGPLDRRLALVRRMERPSDLWAVDPLRTLHGRNSGCFGDPRLVQWADRYATYSGSSPYQAPATFSCIPYIEQSEGAWYLMGGLAVLAKGLAAAAGKVDAEIRTGAEVERITTRPGGAVGGVLLTNGEHLRADVVVAGVDAEVLYGRLLPDAGNSRRTRRAGRSSSGFILLIGVSGHTENLAHHNVAFSADYRQEFDQIFNRGIPPTDPTFYVCCSSVTDPAQAPERYENWFVMVNAPAGGGSAWDSGREASYRDHLLEVMARRGFDLSGRMAFVEAISPATIEADTCSSGGAIYGTSSNGPLAAFARPANRGSRPGLYLVGGSTHPGGGLPLVAMSGSIVASMIEADFG